MEGGPFALDSVLEIEGVKWSILQYAGCKHQSAVWKSSQSSNCHHQLAHFLQLDCVVRKLKVLSITINWYFSYEKVGGFLDSQNSNKQ